MVTVPSGETLVRSRTASKPEPSASNGVEKRSKSGWNVLAVEPGEQHLLDDRDDDAHLGGGGRGGGRLGIGEGGVGGGFLRSYQRRMTRSVNGWTLTMSPPLPTLKSAPPPRARNAIHGRDRE